MLNQRQIEILLEFCNHTEEYLTASYFADKLNVSLRTVQGDMKAIKTELEEESCAHIESKASKGSCIVVEDADEFSAFVNSLYQEYTTVSLNYPTSRISKILLLLLSRHRAVTMSEMEEKYFVSKSTLLNDLKKVEEVLDKFHLELMHGNNKVMVDGFYVQPNELDITEDLGKEYEISKDIFEKIGRRFFIKVTDEEIKYFALYLKGQGNNRDSDTITPEMNKFITEAFAQIKENFGVDFTDNINLRITLALHCMSLQIRIKYDMQMKNDMLDYIRETFPMGYDIGTYFAFLLSQKYGKKVSDDETALLAVHFYSSLMELNSSVGKIKILVISSLKNSMTLLLKQSLIRWFSDRVSTVDFCNPMDVTEDMLDEYDIFLTTEKDEFFEKGLAMYVNAFPNQHDYANIKLNLDGFKDIEDIASIFYPELFYQVKSSTKKEVLQGLCDRATKYFEIEDLHSQVQQREEIGSTYFSKQIAVPHPMYAVSSDTFVSVCVSKQPIVWDEEDNQVNLIMLMHIGKNNTQAFQLWDYISKIFADKTLVEKLVEDPSYDKFIALMKEALESGLNQ